MPTEDETVALACVTATALGDTIAAELHFDDEMSHGLPPEKLTAVWADDVAAQLGEFGRAEVLWSEPLPDGGSVVVIVAQFAGGRRSLTVAVRADHRIQGFFTNAAAPTARRFVTRLSRAQFVSATEPFAEPLRKAAPPEHLESFWTKFVGAEGGFREIERIRVVPAAQFMVAFVTVKCASGSRPLKVVMDHGGQIVGFFIESDGSESHWRPPPYASADKIREQPILVGLSPPLMGHLTLPRDKPRPPVAILVPGSGPADEDETLGDNKPFKDLAEGLAARGIAVLRYQKRTSVRPALSGRYTVKEEYFDSIPLALKLIRDMKDKVNADDVILIGHSLGGELAPWIAKENPSVRAVALLAAPARFMLDAEVDQFEQLVRQHPEDEELVKGLASARKARERIRSPDLDPDEKIHYAIGAYWQSLLRYDPIKTARELEIPMFVAQGGRDYNVSVDRDFDVWRRELAQRKDVTFRLYDDVNHLFIPWGGEPSTKDNAHSGHVVESLVSDLAKWILGLAPDEQRKPSRDESDDERTRPGEAIGSN